MSCCGGNQVRRVRSTQPIKNSTWGAAVPTSSAPVAGAEDTPQEQPEPRTTTTYVEATGDESEERLAAASKIVGQANVEAAEDDGEPEQVASEPTEAPVDDADAEQAAEQAEEDEVARKNRERALKAAATRKANAAKKGKKKDEDLL